MPGRKGGVGHFVRYSARSDMIGQEPGGRVLPEGVEVSVDGAVVILGATLDACTEPGLHAMFDELTAGGVVEKLVIDLSRVEFCDAAGLRILVRAWKIATRRGLVLHLRNAPPLVAELLAITGVGRLSGYPPQNFG
jgi:anti-sigma B factor antagonist